MTGLRRKIVVTAPIIIQVLLHTPTIDRRKWSYIRSEEVKFHNLSPTQIKRVERVIIRKMLAKEMATRSGISMYELKQYRLARNLNSNVAIRMHATGDDCIAPMFKVGFTEDIILQE